MIDLDYRNRVMKAQHNWGIASATGKKPVHADFFERGTSVCVQVKWKNPFNPLKRSRAMSNRPLDPDIDEPDPYFDDLDDDDDDDDDWDDDDPDPDADLDLDDDEDDDCDDEDDDYDEETRSVLSEEYGP